MLSVCGGVAQSAELHTPDPGFNDSASNPGDRNPKQKIAPMGSRVRCTLVSKGIKNKTIVGSFMIQNTHNKNM